MSDACARFRAALETTTPRPVGLKDYPLGACGETCELLADYLRTAGRGDPMFVSAVNQGTGQTHAWLELGELVIDITADQFDGVDDPVIVTTDRSWHDSHFLSSGHHRPAGLAYWDGPARAEVERYYARLLSVLDEVRRPRGVPSP
jgi:hypothetical protein